MLRLSDLRFTKGSQGLQARLCADLEHDGEIRPLWLSFDTEYEEFVAGDRYDSFLTAVFLHAMELGEDIVVEGPVSERLCYAYRHQLGPAIALLNPVLRAVDIHPESYAPPPAGGDAPAIGYSGGVDSMYALLQLLDEKTEPAFRPTHLLFANAGTHGNSFYGDIGKARGLFQERLRKVESFAKEIGLKVIAVDTNWHEQLAWQPLNHVVTFIPGVAQALQKGLGKFHLPDQFNLLDTRHWAPGNLVVFQSALVPWFSTDGFSCLPLDARSGRFQKTVFLAEQPLARKYLDVCVTPYGVGGSNCTTGCTKCRRTTVTLDIIGRLGEFSGIFDPDKYARHRTRLMRGILVSAVDDPFAAEIVEYADRVGYEWPMAVRISATAKRVERRIRRGLKPVWPLFRAIHRKIFGYKN